MLNQRVCLFNWGNPQNNMQMGTNVLTAANEFMTVLVDNQHPTNIGEATDLSEKSKILVNISGLNLID